MKKLLTLLTVGAMVVGLSGCANLQQAVAKLIPNVEAKLGEEGVSVKIDPSLGLSGFCLNPDGNVAAAIGSVPFLGGLVLDLVGTCEE